MADKENTKASGSFSASSSGSGGGSSSGSSAKAGSSGGKIGGSSSGFGGSLSKGGSGKSSPSFGKVYSSTGGNKVSQKVSSKSSGASRNYAKSTTGGGAGSTASPGTRASLGGAKFAPSWVGKNPYQWGNTTAGIQDYGDRDPERQAKIDALGYAADDPDRSFHYYNPDPSSSKGYLDRANSISTDRNFFQANNFWNTIDGPYESEDARKSDAAQWMTDAQIYGKWAEDHGLSYTDDDGNTVNMADVWKDIWNYANEITGGIGDSESTVAGRDIEAYLTGGKYDSATTQQMLDKAKYFADNAESEKEASLWADYEKSLKIQLEADQKQEKKDNSFLGKAWDAVTGWFEKPERAEQGELTDTQKAYQQAAAEDQALSGYATDPLAAAQFAPIAEKRDELAEQVKAENREAGREVYAGMEDEDRLADATESWLSGRGAGAMAGVAGGMYAVDSAFYDNDEIRQLTQQQWQADQAFLTTGDPKYQAESEALQAQIDDAQRRAIENGESGTPLADPAGMLLESAKGMQDEADQKWQDVTEDMSAAGKMAANVAKTGADVAADVVENAIAPGVGTMRMYLGAGGSGAMEQMGRENNDPDSIAAAAVSRAASAWLSTKLVGGMEGVYGQSVLGGITDDMISGASPATQAAIKTLLNTEGVEEGLEDILNYAADLVMELSPEERLQWDEVGQDAFVGYVLGVLTNGLSAGINYDSKARRELTEEGMEYSQSNLSIEEAAEIGKETTKDQVVMKAPSNESQHQSMATSQNAAIQGQDQNVAPAPVSQAQNQNMAASQNQALEGQEQNVAPAPANQEQQNRNLSEAQAAALAGQDQNPTPAPQRATNGPSATAEPYTGPELPGASYGGGSTVKVGKTKIPVHFAVVPISELNVSHDIYGNQNQNYPSELQPRDRSRGTAQNQAIEIGTNLDPGELEWSNNATTGAPIIRPDGTVISGNGRTMGIGYALETGRGTDYIQHIRDNAERFGIDPNSVGEDSVLVRVADGDYNWQAMAEQANVSDVSRMSTTEQAGVDAERLSRYPEILDKLVPNDTGDLNTSDNADFVKDFLQAVVPTSEQGSVWTEQGGLSQEGMRRVQNAVFQMAYGDASLMARLSESLDNNMKNVSNSLLALAPKVATLENNVANGTRYIGIRDTLLEGVKIFEDAKNRGVDVAKVVNQISMDNNASPEAVFIAEFLQNNAKSGKQIRTFLNAMADTAEDFGDPQQIGFFDTGDTEYTSRDVLEGAIARYEQETGNQLGRPDYDFYGDVFDTGVNREGESGNPAEADTAADRTAPGIGEDAGSGEAGRAGDLASRMESGEVGEEEYLNLISSEEGRTQLANALGLNSNDTKTVADGLSVYLLLQDQLNQLQGQQNQDTAGMLLGEEAETPQNAQSNPAGVNSRAEKTNSNTDVLNAQETAENANPEQNTQNPPSKREKISQYFLNTLTESGRAAGLDPVTYNPTSEAESLTNAAMSLAADEQAVLDRLMSSPAWDGELTDAAWLLENKFYKEFVATGDRTNWDAWRKLETYKISQTAKGLQAVAKQSRPGAAGVLEASLNLLEDFKKGSKENQAVSQQEVAQAEKDVTQVTHRMAEIENSIDQRVDSGMNEAEAKAMSKEAYLDLAEKINQIRNTGQVYLFGGKKKFRNMLGSQDMDFIQRFVACQAAGIAEDVNYKGKQDRLKQLNTFQKLAQLTGTGTWSRNLQGNATFGLIDLLANNGVAVAVDQIVSKATGQRSTGFELGALSKDARAAAKLALDRSILEVAANIDLAENSAMEGYDLSRTRTFDPNGNLVERVLSRWEQWNGYMLNSSDKFFRGGAARSSADAIRRANARNGYQVNDADIQQTADQVAAYRLFQNNGVVAEHADKLREWFNRFGAGVLKPITGKSYERGQFGLGTALTPYTKVPTNIGVKALEFSPAGAAKGFAEIVRTAMDAKTGKATMAQQNQAVTDFARGVTGTALIVGLAQLMKNWPFFKDWENEEDKDVKAQNKAEGKSGMQFNIDLFLRGQRGDRDTTWRNDDHTIDISSIEPANQLLTAASLISEGMPAELAILQSAKENFMGLPSVSALKNIEDTYRYTDTPDDLRQTLKNTAASTAGGVASGFIPAPIRHATTVSDEYARDTSGSNPRERAVNQFKASVPGLRETLPVKTDNFGNEISAGSLGTRLLNTYGGNKYSEINQSDLSREAERLREATGEQLIPSRNGPSSEKFGDEKVKFTAEERKDWKDEYGQDLSDAVGMLMKSSVYRDADDDLKAELWKNLEGYAKDEVKAEYADDHYLQYESKYDYLDDVDNPITFLTTNKAFNIAEENEDYDIVDTLIGPVGRLSQDEQDLMRKKNSTLMNYYDYLTPNDRGYKVKDAETVRQFKKDAKANAEGRGKTSASGQDKFGSVYDGYRNKAFTDGDVDAIMSKSKTTEDEETGETTVTWDITKGRAAIYLAMRAGGASVQEALDAVKNADVDYDNTIDEKGVKIKAEYEGTNALKRYGSGNSAMWYEFNEIMYPWKNKR